jgi:hypothetical protein
LAMKISQGLGGPKVMTKVAADGLLINISVLLFTLREGRKKRDGVS